MTYNHCPVCGSTDAEIVRTTGCNSTVYRCEDCGYEYEIDNDLYGYNTCWGWRDAIDDE